MSQRSRFAAACTVLLTGLLFAPVAQAATTCTPTKWPAPPGASSYTVRATDGIGTYVGSASFSDASATVIWHRGGAIERVDGFSASDINGSGLMSGSVRGTDGVRTAATRTLAGAVTLLSQGDSFASAVNDHGDVAGDWFMSQPAAQFAIAWEHGEPSGETLSAWGFSSSHGIDDNKLVPYTYQWRGANTVFIVQLVPGGSARQLRRYSPVDIFQPIRPYDVDGGLVLATRTEAAGQPAEIVLIEPVSGTITPVPGTRGATPGDLNDGVVVGQGVNGATMWRDGETVVLPPLAGTTSRTATLVNADGTEVFGTSSSGFATVWRCSA